MSIVLSWNVAGRVRAVPQQAVAVAEQSADLIALQEVRVNSTGAWRTALEEVGYEHILTTLDTDDPIVRLEPNRRLGVLVAARERLYPQAGPDVPWPERMLVACLDFAGTTVEICNLHSRTSSMPDEVQVRTLDAVAAYLAEPSVTPRIVVGDLNASIIAGIAEHGYRDASPSIQGDMDHILVRDLEVEAGGYRHDWRQAKLSDSSGIWAELAIT